MTKIILLILVLPFLTKTQAAIERTVTLKKEAEVWSNNICLDDMIEEAWLKTRCHLEKKKCCGWRVGSNLITQISKEEIQRKAAQMDFTGWSIKVGGNNSIVVKQTGRELTCKDIEDRLVPLLREKLGLGTSQELKLNECRMRIPTYVSFEDQNRWEFKLPEELRNPLEFPIVLKKEFLQNLGFTQVKFALFQEVYVAKKTISPTQLIQKEDFILKKTDVLNSYLSGNMVYGKDVFPEGQQAKQSIFVGTPLSYGLLERNPIVRLGDSVTLILRSHNLRISTRGVVQGSAAVGDMVTVQLSRYNRTFRGKLLDGKLVEVWL